MIYSGAFPPGVEMSSEQQRFVDGTTEQVRPLEKDYLLSEWEAAVQGTPEALARTQQAQAAYMRFWSDVGRYEAAGRYNEQAGADAELARQVRLIRSEERRVGEECRCTWLP